MKHIIDRYAWQEVCNGVICANCTMSDGTGACRLGAYIQSQPEYEERSHGEWGKWVISEVRCPECLEYFDTGRYSKEEMDKCPNCGADMREGDSDA